MSSVIAGLLFGYSCMTLISFAATKEGDYDFTNYPVTPTDVYDKTMFNYPTCILLSLLLIGINPIYVLCKFIYWVTHVGRE